MSTEATDTPQDPNQMDEAALERATAPDPGKGDAGTQDAATPEPEKLAATPPEAVKPNVTPQSPSPQHARPAPGQRGNDRGHYDRKNDRHERNQRAQGAPEVPERIGGIKGLENLSGGGQQRHGRHETRQEDRRTHQTPQDKKEERPAMSTTQPDPNEGKKLDLEIEKAKGERLKLLSPRLEAAERIWNIDKPLGKQYLEALLKNF